MIELYKLFKAGKMVEKDLVSTIFTDIGSNLFTYMVMLKNADRNKEAKMLEEFRTRIFKARDLWNDKEETSIRDMRQLSVELNVIYDMLQIHKPEESIILQWPANHMLGFVWILEEIELGK